MRIVQQLEAGKEGGDLSWGNDLRKLINPPLIHVPFSEKAENSIKYHEA